jgi:hypothetical protein
LRTAIATKILVVEAIGRISSASLPKISSPVAASSTTAERDWMAGASFAQAVRVANAPNTAQITRGRMRCHHDTGAGASRLSGLGRIR